MKRAFIFALAFAGLTPHAADAKKRKQQASPIYVLSLVKPSELTSEKQLKEYSSKKEPKNL